MITMAYLGEEIKKLTSNNVLRALSMIDPGFRMNVSNVAGSNPNALPDFEMRGRLYQRLFPESGGG